MDKIEELKIKLTSQDERVTRRLSLSAGAAYGVVFGFSFALFTWGIDAYLLASNSVAYSWYKLIYGLPLAVIIGGLVGWLAAYTTSIALSVVVWVAFGALFGVIAGHIPFEGANLAYWIVDGRLWGEIIYAFGDAASVRTILVVILNIFAGVVVGFVEGLALGWAWDRSTPEGKMSLGSWTVLLVGVPVAFLSALAVNGFIYQPLRHPQMVVGELLKRTLSGEGHSAEEMQASLRSIEPYLDSISDQYTIYFVKFGFDTGTWDSAYVDVVFNDGFSLRCSTVMNRVLYCDDLSSRFSEWVGWLVGAGLEEERPWLDARITRLAVDETVVSWLTEHRNQLSKNYTWSRDGQYADWIYISVQFDTGFQMVCRFREVTPVIVDQCVSANLD